MPKGESPLALIPPILSFLALSGTLGFFYYSKMIYKRPVITEGSERKRLAKIHSKPASENISALLNFEPMTVNIASHPVHPQKEEGTSQQIQGKLHYLTIGFSIEIGNRDNQYRVESLRPALLDRLTSLVGKKEFHELNTFQGRYLLRSQLLEFANKALLASAPPDHAPENVIKNLYFTQFVVQ